MKLGAVSSCKLGETRWFEWFVYGVNIKETSEW